MYKLNNKTIAQAGFTLVELSIVIVIIGFLVAGIAAGANLVKQAQLRSVISDFQSFQTGYNGFVGRFNAAPGDLSVATTYWTTAGTTPCASAAPNEVMCNGDGDGLIEAATDATDEVAATWKHLQLAGFVGAGIATLSAAVPADLVVGVNTPTSKVTGAGYILSSSTNLARTGAAANFGLGANSTNYAIIARPITASFNLIAGAVKAEDAYNLDLKLDDGVINGTNFTGATSGRVRALDDSGAAANACATTNNYTVANQTTACVVGIGLN